MQCSRAEKRPRLHNHLRLCAHVLAASALCMAAAVHAKEKTPAAPGCADESPQQCVAAALDAMGGREGLLQVDKLLNQFFLPEHRNARIT